MPGSDLSSDRIGQLITNLSRLSSQANSALVTAPLVERCECDFPSPLSFLQATRIQPQVYWSSRDGNLEIAGCGSAWEIRERDADSFGAGLAAVQAVVDSSSPETPVYIVGGTCFDPSRRSGGRWSAFPALWFLLPRLAVVRQGRRQWLTAYSLPGDQVSMRQLAAELPNLIKGFEHDRSESGRAALPEMVERTDTPTQDEWTNAVERVVRKLRRGDIDKVVLARRSDFECRHEVNPPEFLRRLRESAGRSYGVLLQPGAGRAFVAASPEQLFGLAGSNLTAEAVAGTSERGSTVDDVEVKKRSLMASSKNRSEHQYVVNGLNDDLTALCEDLVSADAPEILEWEKLLHLRTPITARLRSGVGIADLLRSMHPTAAVCGLPRRAALELIAETESFDRGWYAGAVGFVTRKRCEFTVAIRSALLLRRRLSLYAGAGIVASSDPKLEWQELEQKITAGVRLLSEATV